MPNIGFEFNFSGLEALANQIERLPRVVVHAAAKSLNESFEMVLTDANENYVPIDTGALKASGNVQVFEQADSVEVQIGYGGPSAPYATAVHEINKHYRNGRTWKYLELPLKAALPSIGGKLYDDVNEAMGSV